VLGLLKILPGKNRHPQFTEGPKGLRLGTVFFIFGEALEDHPMGGGIPYALHEQYPEHDHGICGVITGTGKHQDTRGRALKKAGGSVA
jgi:hypothetical protein